MKYTKFFLLIVFCLFVSSLFADVIYFANGDIDEGYVKIKDGQYIITTKDMLGSYGIRTNKVNAVKYGEWLENLDEATQKVAENTKKTKTIIGSDTQRTINKVNEALPKSVSTFACRFNVEKGNIWENMDIQILIILSVLFLLLIVACVCQIVLLVDAFKYSVLWGLLCLFVPFVMLIYLFTNYSGNRGKMFFWLMAPLMWIVVAILVVIITR